MTAVSPEPFFKAGAASGVVARVAWAVLLVALLLWPFVATGDESGGEADASAGGATGSSAPSGADGLHGGGEGGDDVGAQGSFSRNLNGIRWHALRVSMSGTCPTGFQGTLTYTATYGNTEAPQQAFLAFRDGSPPSVTFGIHQHVVDGRAYTATVLNGNKNIQSANGLNDGAPPTFMSIFASGGCTSTQYFVYWSSGNSSAQVSFSWTSGTVTIVDSSGTDGTFAYTKADMGGTQARHGTQCNPCRFVGAGALMTKQIPIQKRMVGAFLPDPGAPTDNCAPTSNGEYSCNNWSPDVVVAQQSSWRSPSGRLRVLAPVVDERIFVVGTAAEVGAWTFSTTADVDVNPMAAALSGVDVQLP